jgi:hypothetical protein
MRTEKRTAPGSVTHIIAAARGVLKARQGVSLPEEGIDLLFDGGVVARCRVCEVSWHVSRTQYAARGWWSCPSGCKPINQD